MKLRLVIGCIAGASVAMASPLQTTSCVSSEVPDRCVKNDGADWSCASECRSYYDDEDDHFSDQCEVKPKSNVSYRQVADEMSDYCEGKDSSTTVNMKDDWDALKLDSRGHDSDDGPDGPDSNDRPDSPDGPDSDDRQNRPDGPGGPDGKKGPGGPDGPGGKKGPGGPDGPGDKKGPGGPDSNDRPDSPDGPDSNDRPDTPDGPDSNDRPDSPDGRDSSDTNDSDDIRGDKTSLRNVNNANTEATDSNGGGKAQVTTVAQLVTVVALSAITLNS